MSEVLVWLAQLQIRISNVIRWRKFPAVLMFFLFWFCVRLIWVFGHRFMFCWFALMSAIHDDDDDDDDDDNKKSKSNWQTDDQWNIVLWYVTYTWTLVLSIANHHLQHQIIDKPISIIIQQLDSQIRVVYNMQIVVSITLWKSYIRLQLRSTCIAYD